MNIDKREMDSTQKKTGYNIINLVDVAKISKDFVDFYYTNLKKNPDELIKSGILQDITTYKFNNLKYNGHELLKLLSSLRENNYDINHIEFIDSGSRRLDILVVGKYHDKIFSQSFGLCHKNGWFIKNSVLIIK